MTSEQKDDPWTSSWFANGANKVNGEWKDDIDLRVDELKAKRMKEDVFALFAKQQWNVWEGTIVPTSEQGSCHLHLCSIEVAHQNMHW